jgi:hypothetical protein
MLYKAKVAVSSEIHTKHINANVIQNSVFLNVKPGGMKETRWALKG